MSQPLVLDVRNLEVAYASKWGLRDRLRRAPRRVNRAVQGVSLTLAVGEMVALVGESGSGKTSTLRAVLGQTPRAAGEIAVLGTPLDRLRRDRRAFARTVQVVYQDPYESLDPRLTVREALQEPIRIHRLATGRPERERMCAEALERAGLTPAAEFMDRLPQELSGGQRQRVAIAVALMLGPRVLLADEPVAMLDVSVRAEILNLLDELRREQEVGLLMVTHDLSTAVHYADRVLVMYKGELVEERPADRFVAESEHPYSKALIAAIPRLHAEPAGAPPDLRAAQP